MTALWLVDDRVSQVARLRHGVLASGVTCCWLAGEVVLWAATLQELPPSSSLQVELPGELERDGGLVLVGLQLGVIVRELVVEDGDGHPVEDDTKRDAREGHHPAQHCVRHCVSVAHCGEADLRRGKEERQNEDSICLDLKKKNQESPC